MTGRTAGRMQLDPDQLRLRVLEVAHAAHKGHIGSALSIVDIVAACIERTRGLGTDDALRDRFVLSKGHAAMALYAALEAAGVLDLGTLRPFADGGTKVATHPHADLPGIDFSTGSLGQGITFAVGSAMASARAGGEFQVRCVLSDSELGEGATWEAALLAGHHGLAALTVVLDSNKQQALGRVDDVLRTGPALDSWKQLGWDVVSVDGHDVGQIGAVLDSFEPSPRPLLVVADTTAGFGVPFMEAKVEWHYLPMSEEQFLSAREAVTGRGHAR